MKELRHGMTALPYRSIRGLVGIAPYAVVQAQDFHTPSYSETDLTGGGFGLSYAAMNGTDTRSELGAAFRRSRPRLTAYRSFYSPRRLGARLGEQSVARCGISIVAGRRLHRQRRADPTKFRAHFRRCAIVLHAEPSLLAKFDGEFAPGSQTYAGSGTLRYTW